MKESEKAYIQIRRMIVFTTLKPGQEINVSDLVDELEIGKTPIREALNILAHEGYVRILPRKGMLVSTLDVNDLDKLRELRLYFIRFISESAIVNVTENDIEKIKTIQEKLRSQESTFESCLAADIEFHEFTYELCNNKYAEKMMKRNLYLSIRLMIMKRDIGVDLKSIIEDYDQLITCLTNKDKFSLESFLLNHMLG